MSKKKIIMAVILFLVSMLLLLMPFIKNKLVDNMSGINTSFTAKQFTENNKKDALNDYDSVKRPSMMAVFNHLFKSNEEAVIGEIHIDSVGIHLPILKGTNDGNLLSGATTMLNEQKMGEGNYSLAGHHMSDESILFGPLMGIKLGAVVIITDKTNDYSYEVTDMAIVSETDVSVLEDKGEDRLTLFTCDIVTATDKRFVVSAKFIKKTMHKELVS